MTIEFSSQSRKLGVAPTRLTPFGGALVVGREADPPMAVVEDGVVFVRVP